MLRGNAKHGVDLLQHLLVLTSRNRNGFKALIIIQRLDHRGNLDSLWSGAKDGHHLGLSHYSFPFGRWGYFLLNHVRERCTPTQLVGIVSR